MKHIKHILIIAAAISLAGCASSESVSDSGANAPVTSEQDDRQVRTQESSETSEGTSEQSGEDDVVVSRETENYSIDLSYTVFDDAGDTQEISPASLEITPKETGEKLTPGVDLLLGVSQSDDRFVVNGSPELDIIELPEWNVAAVRVPRLNGGELVHETSFYYFNDSTVQLLGNNLFRPMLPADSEIEADAENNCFSFVNAEGGIERYTVAYDEYYEGNEPYVLRSADYTPEPVTASFSTEYGEITFTYTVYDRGDNQLRISANNFVEFTDSSGEKHSCEVRSPIYQPAVSFDNLTNIEAPIEFETKDLADCGIAAVRVPYTDPDSGEKLHSVTFYYYDDSTLQFLGDGYFIPEIPADSEIEADINNNRFSVTDTEGVTEWYAPVPDPDDEQHIQLQKVAP